MVELEILMEYEQEDDGQFIRPSFVRFLFHMFLLYYFLVVLAVDWRKRYLWCKKERRGFMWMAEKWGHVTTIEWGIKRLNALELLKKQKKRVEKSYKKKG